MTSPAGDLNAHGQFTRRAAMASLSVAFTLLLLKAVAEARTGSVAMLGSLADSTLDLVASLVTLLGVRWAAMPADHQHRFGHGKAEALAALFQVTLITMAAVMIAWESLRRFGAGSVTEQPAMGIGVSVFAIVISLALVTYQKRIIARTGSLAISTDHLHYQSDLYLNLSVIIALVLDHYAEIRGADQFFGFGIAAWLAYGAWKSAMDAVDHLMDREWPVDERQHFLEVALQHPELRGIHDMRTRMSGAARFVQFHASVDPEMTVRHAHEVMDELEAALHRAFPGVDIIIHPDPEGYDEEQAHNNPLRGGEAGEVLKEEMDRRRPA